LNLLFDLDINFLAQSARLNQLIMDTLDQLTLTGNVYIVKENEIVDKSIIAQKSCKRVKIFMPAGELITG